MWDLYSEAITALDVFILNVAVDLILIDRVLHSRRIL